MSHSERKAARAILVTPEQSVLLMRMAFPWLESEIWILPGGGIEPGETAEQTVVREVYEETGGTNLDLVGEAWQYSHFVEAANMQFSQQYFLIHTDWFVPQATDLTEKEMDWVLEYRWWPVAELATASLNVDPPGFAQELPLLLTQGLPGRPLLLG